MKCSNNQSGSVQVHVVYKGILFCIQEFAQLAIINRPAMPALLIAIIKLRSNTVTKSVAWSIVKIGSYLV